MNLNICHIAGYLGRDPELRYTPKGDAVAEFSIAVTRTYGTGEDKKKETTWFNCVAWTAAAENIHKYCQRGSNLFVSGYLKQEEWTDKNTGQKRTALKLVVNSFQFVSSPQQQGQQQQEEAAPRNAGAQQTQPAFAETQADPFGAPEDQIPF